MPRSMPVLKSRSGRPASVSISFRARAVNDGVSDPMVTRDVDGVVADDVKAVRCTAEHRAAPGDGRRRRGAQWAADLENRFKTTTPATISPMPPTAAASSFWPRNSQPIAATSVTPTPDQTA